MRQEKAYKQTASSFFASAAIVLFIIGSYLDDVFYRYIIDGGGIAIMMIGMASWCREYRIKSERKEQEVALINKLIFEKKKKGDKDSD